MQVWILWNQRQPWAGVNFVGPMLKSPAFQKLRDSSVWLPDADGGFTATVWTCTPTSSSSSLLSISTKFMGSFSWMGSFSCLGDIVWFLRLKTEENKYENWKARVVERIYEYGGGNTGKVLPYTPLLKYYEFIVKKLLIILMKNWYTLRRNVYWILS